MSKVIKFWSEHKNLNIGDGSVVAQFADGLFETDDARIIAMLNGKIKARICSLVNLTELPPPPKIVDPKDAIIEQQAERIKALESDVAGLVEAIEEKDKTIAALQAKPKEAKPKDAAK